jgi:carboxynorspermidine decarboxylase
MRTPYYIVDEEALTRNLRLLREVAEEAGCKILLAQKAFSMFAVYPLLRQYLAGTASSGLYEAKLGHDEFGGETHVFSAAYEPDEFTELLDIADHIVFNSFSQWERFGKAALDAGKSCGIRINPECSTQNHAIYDPCAPGSRLGVTAANFRLDLMDGLDGLHFHTLCEQDSDVLVVTLNAVEEKFADALRRVKWVNFGGGHHITRPGYDIERLIRAVKGFRARWGTEVYLEPGEAVALGAGELVSTVLDVVENGIKIAILDASAACHMPDVLEMPYRPEALGAGKPGEKAFDFRLACRTCLAGDVIGDYSFDEPLGPGDNVVFRDMAIYTMVKNNTFNGMRLPSITLRGADGTVRLIREFGYEDFKNRLS